MRVLVMSDGLQGTLACIQSMGRLGHSVTVLVGQHPSPMAFSSFVEKRIRPAAPENSIAAKAAAVAAIVAFEKIDVVIPVHDEDARIVAAARERHPDVAAFVISSAASVAVASDKVATLAIAHELELPVPPSLVVESAAGVPEAARQLGLPLVIKVPVSTASLGTFIVRTRGELKRCVAGLPSGPILVQGFIDGTFVGITGFADRGDVLEHFAFHIPREIGSAGTPAYALSGSSPGLVPMLDAICRRLEWTGGIDLDVLVDNTGGLYLLEANPRFSGTLVFADKLGIDLPRYYPEHVAGAGYHKPAPPPPTGALFVSLGEEASARRRDPRGMAKLAKSLKKDRLIVDNLYPEDAGMAAAAPPPNLQIAS